MDLKIFSKLIVLQYIENNVQATINMLEDPAYRDDFIKLIQRSDTNIKTIKLNRSSNIENFFICS